MIIMIIMITIIMIIVILILSGRSDDALLRGFRLRRVRPQRDFGERRQQGKEATFDLNLRCI